MGGKCMKYYQYECGKYNDIAKILKCKNKKGKRNGKKV